MMTPTEEITITVPTDLAKRYNNATAIAKQEIETKIIFLLKSQMTSRQEAIAKLRQTMSKIGQKASDRGLTPEILEDILRDDNT